MVVIYSSWSGILFSNSAALTWRAVVLTNPITSGIWVLASVYLSSSVSFCALWLKMSLLGIILSNPTTFDSSF